MNPVLVVIIAMQNLILLQTNPAPEACELTARYIEEQLKLNIIPHYRSLNLEPPKITAACIRETEI